MTTFTNSNGLQESFRPLLVLGQSGKMGKLITLNAANYGFDVGPYEHLQNVRLNMDNVALVTTVPSLIIDASFHLNLNNAIALAQKFGAPLLCMTTGHRFDVQNYLQNLDNSKANRQNNKAIAVFYSANTLISLALFIQSLKNIAFKLKNIESIIIEDIHHIHKKDAPSGTSIMIAKALAQSLGFDDASINELAKVQLLSECVHGNSIYMPLESEIKPAIGFKSIRKGETIGTHSVTFNCKDEVLTFTHQCNTRALFANGALEIGAWLINQTSGYYNMWNYIGC